MLRNCCLTQNWLYGFCSYFMLFLHAFSLWDVFLSLLFILRGKEYGIGWIWRRDLGWVSGREKRSPKIYCLKILKQKQTRKIQLYCLKKCIYIGKPRRAQHVTKHESDFLSLIPRTHYMVEGKKLTIQVVLWLDMGTMIPIHPHIYTDTNIHTKWIKYNKNRRSQIKTQ